MFTFPPEVEPYAMHLDRCGDVLLSCAETPLKPECDAEMIFFGLCVPSPTCFFRNAVCIIESQKGLLWKVLLKTIYSNLPLCNSLGYLKPSPHKVSSGPFLQAEETQTLLGCGDALTTEGLQLLKRPLA